MFYDIQCGVYVTLSISLHSWKRIFLKTFPNVLSFSLERIIHDVNQQVETLRDS